MNSQRLSNVTILRFWIPLAGTWLMMAAEGPFLAAIIARLQAPVENLAAFGVAFAAAVIVESPVVMLLSASTALVTDRSSFLALRRFTYRLSGAMTALILLLQWPVLSHALFVGLLDLPADIADLTADAYWFLIPWPGAIGYRRFYQGLLIRRGQTRWVGFGTIFRLAAMAGAAAVAARITQLPGATIGTIALSTGVLLEAVVSRVVSRHVVRDLMSGKGAGPDLSVSTPAPAASLTPRYILAFYIPLALTSMLGMAVQPALTFFLGHSRSAVESLAVLPVVNGVTFLFRSLGLSYHEATVALLGDQGEHYRRIRSFAVALVIATSGGLALISFTPLSRLVFEEVAGLSPALAAFALIPCRILVPLPGFTVWLSVQRGVLVRARRTRMVTWSTAVEVTVIVTVVWWGIERADLPGVVAAAAALMLGRISGTLVLIWPMAATVRGFRPSAAPER